MPYALFCNDSKLSKAYPTEADVWKVAPRPVLDNDYEIRPCEPDSQEDPVQNKAEADRDAKVEPELGS